MSLSLFLLHPLVNTLINLGYARASGELMPWWMLAAIGPPLAILIAYAYFRLVEVPIRRYRSGSAQGTPKGSPSANKLATASK
jgi:peptidoglycan/LPS O-acetylase OafA/YrhL